jgi:hypothetical protein
MQKKRRKQINQEMVGGFLLCQKIFSTLVSCSCRRCEIVFNKKNGIGMATHQSKLQPQQSVKTLITDMRKAFFDACRDSSIPVSVFENFDGPDSLEGLSCSIRCEHGCLEKKKTRLGR